MRFIKLFRIPAELEAIKRMLDCVLGNLHQIQRELRIVMNDQEKLDALAASENADLSVIATDLSAINSAITAQRQAFEDFKTANPGVDTSGLEASQSQLDSVTASLGKVADAINSISVAPPAAPITSPEGDTAASDTAASTGSEAPPSGT